MDKVLASDGINNRSSNNTNGTDAVLSKRINIQNDCINIQLKTMKIKLPHKPGDIIYTMIENKIEKLEICKVVIHIGGVTPFGYRDYDEMKFDYYYNPNEYPHGKERLMVGKTYPTRQHLIDDLII